eukprot:scpid101470/ scgid7557/ 
MFGLVRQSLLAAKPLLGSCKVFPTSTSASPSLQVAVSTVRQALQPVRFSETWTGGGGKLGTNRKRKHGTWTYLRPNKHKVISAILTRIIPTGDGQFMRFSRNMKKSADRRPEYRHKLKHIKYVTETHAKFLTKWYGPIKKFRTLPPHSHTKLISSEGRKLKGKPFLR